MKLMIAILVGFLTFAYASPVPPSDDASGLECTICSLIVSVTESLVKKDNLNATQIDTELLHLCSKLGSTYSGTCVVLVKLYGTKIVAEIVAGTNPSTICEGLKLCNSTTSTPSSETSAIASALLHLKDGKKGAISSNNTVCTICEFIVVALEVSIKTGNLTESEILTDVEKVCALVGNYKTECSLLIGLYAPKFIQALVNGESGQQLCTQYKICTSSSSSSSASKMNKSPLRQFILQALKH